MDIGSIGSIVASGMQAMRTKADAHAHNLANAQTPGMKRLDVRTTERSTGGVDLLVQRDPAPGNLLYASESAPRSSSADDSASAGSSTPGSPQSTVAQGPIADARADSDSPNPVGNRSFVEGSNVDVVEETIGLQQSVQGMSMLAAVYQRADQAMGTMFDAFG